MNPSPAPAAEDHVDTALDVIILAGRCEFFGRSQSPRTAPTEAGSRAVPAG